MFLMKVEMHYETTSIIITQLVFFTEFNENLTLLSIKENAIFLSLNICFIIVVWMF